MSESGLDCGEKSLEGGKKVAETVDVRRKNNCCMHRMIRLIECNVKCRNLTNLTSKGTLRQVFLSV